MTASPSKPPSAVSYCSTIHTYTNCAPLGLCFSLSLFLFFVPQRKRKKSPSDLNDDVEDFTVSSQTATDGFKMTSFPLFFQPKKSKMASKSKATPTPKAKAKATPTLEKKESKSPRATGKKATPKSTEAVSVTVLGFIATNLIYHLYLLCLSPFSLSLSLSLSLRVPRREVVGGKRRRRRRCGNGGWKTNTLRVSNGSR